MLQRTAQAPPKQDLDGVKRALSFPTPRTAAAPAFCAIPAFSADRAAAAACAALGPLHGLLPQPTPAGAARETGPDVQLLSMGPCLDNLLRLEQAQFSVQSSS